MRAWRCSLPVGMLFSLVAEASTLEEVVVTAQRRLQPLQEVPVAVSVLSRDQLQDFVIRDTQRLQALTPSLVFNNRGPIAQPFIRGVGTTLSLLGLEPSVATYVDDQYYPRPAGSIMELPDVERVEVLKGPQGVLYGRNATGGAIRVVTREPAAEPAARVSLTAGNYDYRKLSAYTEGAITDSLLGNLSAYVAQRDGYAEQQEPGLDDLDDLDIATYRGKLAWAPADRFSARLSLDYTRRDDTAGAETIDISSAKSILGTTPFAIGNSWAEGLGGPVPPLPVGNVAPTGKRLDAVRSGVDAANEQSMLNAQLRLEWELARLSIASITTYQDAELETNTADFDASRLQLSDMQDEEHNEAFSQEFQLLSDADATVSWLAGVWAFESRGHYQVWMDGQDLVVAGFQRLEAPRSELDVSAWALYGQLDWQFASRWSLGVGGRYSEERKEVSAGLAGAEVGDAERWGEFTPRVALEYSFEHGLAYLSYSRGFKSGGFAYPYVSGYSDGIVDPESLDAFELGLKLQWPEQALSLNSALYFYDYENFQVNRNAGLVPGVGIVIPVENADGAEVLGWEVDLSWQPTPGLSLQTGFNLMDAEYTAYPSTPSIYNTALLPGPVVLPVPYDASGDDMVRAPQVSAYLALRQEWQLAGGASLPLSLVYAWRDEYNFDLMPGDASNRIDEYRSDAYGILNARIAYQSAGDNWSLALWANNLTDEKYYDEVVAFATAVRATLGEPRTYGVELSWEF